MIAKILICGAVVSLAYGVVTDVSLTSTGLAGVILSWLTNIWSTGLISWKTWYVL